MCSCAAKGLPVLRLMMQALVDAVDFCAYEHVFEKMSTQVICWRQRPPQLEPGPESLCRTWVSWDHAVSTALTASRTCSSSSLLVSFTLACVTLRSCSKHSHSSHLSAMLLIGSSLFFKRPCGGTLAGWTILFLTAFKRMGTF